LGVTLRRVSRSEEPSFVTFYKKFTVRISVRRKGSKRLDERTHQFLEQKPPVLCDEEGGGGLAARRVEVNAARQAFDETARRG
jgi:hypothetical protein